MSFVAAADPVPEGTVKGEVSGAVASTHDRGHSTGVSKWKSLERGTVTPHVAITDTKCNSNAKCNNFCQKM